MVMCLALAVLVVLLAAGTEGSTITHDFNADNIISFLHGLPHYDLTLHKSDNRFDPKSWSYDQTMIWFVVPGAAVILITLLLAVAVAICRCLRACCLRRFSHHEDSFDSFPSLSHRDEDARHQRRTPKWVRGVHVVTFILMLTAIGVVIVSWLASYDFFMFVDDSFAPVDDTNKLVADAFDDVETLLSMSKTGLSEVVQLNSTYMDIKNDVLVFKGSVTSFADALGLLPNLTALEIELSSWEQKQVIDLPVALSPIYSGLAAMNASLVAMPNISAINAALVELNSTVDLAQLVDPSQLSLLLSLVPTANQIYHPLLSNIQGIHSDLKALEGKLQGSLLSLEKPLVAGVLTGGANPPYPDSVTALANQIQQRYIATGDAISALPSVQRLVEMLIQYNNTGSLPANVSSCVWQMKASYETYLPASRKMETVVPFLALLAHYNPSAIARFLCDDISPALSQVLHQLVVPERFQEVYQNWQQQTDQLSGEMSSYRTIQNRINDYLPKIENYVDKAELGRFIYFNVTCVWMLLACILSLLAIFKPRHQSWLMAVLWIALLFAGIEMAIYLPPAVFTSDLCYEPDNFTLSLVPSDETDIAAYVSYYVYCNISQSNPLLPYTQEVREALSEVEPLLATLQNCSSIITAARPYVANLTEQLGDGLREIAHLEQLSNCSTIHPLYNQMKVDVCQHLTPAAFAMFVFRGALVIVMFLVFLLSCFTLGHQKKELADDSFPMVRTRRVAFLEEDRRPLLRAMTEDYLAIPADDRQLRRGRDMVGGASPSEISVSMSINN